MSSDVSDGWLARLHTCGDGGSDGLAASLVLEGHQVDGVLFPRRQVSLVEGGDGAGELGCHTSIVVLESNTHTQWDQGCISPTLD